MRKTSTDQFPGYTVPSYATLKKKFDWVSDGYKNATDWQLHESCRNKAVASLESLELVHYGKDMTDKAVLADFKDRGLRPATLEELLYYARVYPDKQKEFLIVAYGSSCRWGGLRSSPCLGWYVYDRVLGLLWGGGVWGGGDWRVPCRFLAVRA